MQEFSNKARLQEMEGPRRETPSVTRTIEAVMTIVRQSREGDGATPASLSAEGAQMADLFGDGEARETAGQSSHAGHAAETQEAEDLARIRRALYSV